MQIVRFVSSPVAKLPGSYDLLLLSDTSLQYLRITTSSNGNQIDITNSYEVGVNDTLRQKVATTLAVSYGEEIFMCTITMIFYNNESTFKLSNVSS